MSLKIITGVPGAGKSYFSVKHIAENYCIEDNGIYIPKENITIITNVEDLKINHINLDQILSEQSVSLNKFFTVEHQKENVLNEYPKIVYLIDEAQRYFNGYMRDNAVFYFFEYHRHLGLDIYLMTQSIYSLNKRITVLAEYEIRAVPRTLSLVGEFKYKYITGHEIIKHQVIKRDKKIFNLYKSMDAKETDKIKNPFLKYAVIILIVFIASVYGFFHTFGSSSISNEKEKKISTKEIIVENDYNVNPVKLIRKRLGYSMVNNKVYVPDPFNNDNIPLEMYDYGKVERRYINGRLKIYAYLTEEMNQRIIAMTAAKAVGSSLDDSKEENME